MAKQPIPPPRDRKVSVRIRGDHPHSGKLGSILVVDGQCETINMFGTGMVKIIFKDDSACYAELKHIEMIEPTSPPPPRKRQSNG